MPGAQLEASQQQHSELRKNFKVTRPVSTQFSCCGRDYLYCLYPGSVLNTRLTCKGLPNLHVLHAKLHAHCAICKETYLYQTCY
eukprot:1138766-Pelagomonas_calceolata.AAC.7